MGTTMRYPIFCALQGAETLYRIDGEAHLLEWQPLGEDGWLVHEKVANTYPDRLLIAEIATAKDRWEVLPVSEWTKRWSARFDGLTSLSPGRSSLPLDVPIRMEENVDLAPWTTFGISAFARFGTEVVNDDTIRQALQWAYDRDMPILMLGGGSNVLLHQDWDGLALRMAVEGIEVLNDDGDAVQVVVGAGMNWHDWVMYTLDQEWGGLENLALIPGSVGASPMQNIGAYGSELQDCFLWLEAVHVETGILHRFDHKECQFGYRDSIFKGEQLGQWIIVRVAFQLKRTAALNVKYGAIEHELQEIPEDSRTHRDVAEAVIRIRQSKLPDPRVIGNAGSFFKNPILGAAAFHELKQQHPEVAHYIQPDGTVKVAAGWLIEQAGWKGERRGTHGVHDKQALVLVHFGGATGVEIWQLARDIMSDVMLKFGVPLQPEVNQIGLEDKS